MTARILITGGPRTGKTTLARKLASRSGAEIRHTDDLIGVEDWSAASLEVSRWLDQPGPWCIEGVAVPRALRKWLAANPAGKPADRIFWLTEPVVRRTPGQESMAKAVETVWREVVPELRKRGVQILVKRKDSP